MRTSNERKFWIAFAIATSTANVALYLPRPFALALFAIGAVAAVAMIALFARIAAARMRRSRDRA